MPSNFATLHNHTVFSALDGISKIEDIATRCKELNTSACAITDHGNMFGAIPFYHQMTKAGIKPIIGCETYLMDENQPNSRDNLFHLLLLAMNNDGYKNLVRLITLAQDNFYYKPRVSYKMLLEHHEGLFVSTACLASHTSRLISNGMEDKARAVLSKMRDTVGDRLLVELMDHGIQSQKYVNAVMVQLARELGLMTIATNDSHYVWRDDALAHDVALCCAQHKSISLPSKDDLSAEDREEAGSNKYRLKFPNDMFYMCSGDELAERGLPSDAISNTAIVAGKCNLSLKFPLSMPKVQINGVDLPKNKVDSTLIGLSLAGLNRLKENGKLYADYDIYLKRLQYEAGVISRMGFSDYMLMIHDIVKGARSIGAIVGPGRGSSAGCLLAYCLEIVMIDPIRYNIPFERFLNPDRASMPDIDVDVSDKDAVVRYISDKYPNTCRIIAFQTLGAKQLVKDICKAYDLSIEVANSMAGMITEEHHLDKDSVGAEYIMEDGSIDVVKYAYDTNDYFKSTADSISPDFLKIAHKLWGNVRHVGQHASGIIISGTKIDGRVAIYKNQKAKDETMCQVDMDNVEKVGFIKVDILGLNTLRIIHDALKYIESNGKTPPDLYELMHTNADDPAALQIFKDASTFGIFQMAEQGFANFLRKFEVRSFKDVTLACALYRPGPMGASTADNLRTRGTNIRHESPIVAEILKDNYGIMTFQEDIMGIAVKLAGMTLSEADLFRRAISKKDSVEFNKMSRVFIDKASMTGNCTKEYAEKLVSDMHGFSRYGWNKAHACLAGDTTVVSMVRGEIALRDVIPGEHIACMDESTGNMIYQRVLAKMYNGIKNTKIVSTAAGNFIRATGDHLIATDNGYEFVDKLKLRSALKVVDDSSPIFNISSLGPAMALGTQCYQIPRKIVFNYAERNNVVDCKVHFVPSEVSFVSHSAEPAHRHVPTSNTIPVHPSPMYRAHIPANGLISKPTNITSHPAEHDHAGAGLRSNEPVAHQVIMDGIVTQSDPFNYCWTSEFVFAIQPTYDLSNIRGNRSIRAVVAWSFDAKFANPKIKIGLTTSEGQFFNNPAVRPPFFNKLSELVSAVGWRVSETAFGFDIEFLSDTIDISAVEFTTNCLAYLSYCMCRVQSGNHDLLFNSELANIHIHDSILVNDPGYVTDTICNIEEYKPEPVYDLMMDGHPNFVANNIVVHNCCYGTIAYWTAYLKAHYPTEFMCAILNNQDPQDRGYTIAECMGMKIKIGKPDINTSLYSYQVIGDVIVPGITSIPGIGEKTAGSIIKNRPYTSVDELVTKNTKRICNSKVIKALAKAGGLISIDASTESAAEDNIIFALTDATKHNNSLLLTEVMAGKSGQIIAYLSKVGQRLDKFGREMAMMVLSDGIVEPKLPCFSKSYKAVKRSANESVGNIVKVTYNVDRGIIGLVKFDPTMIREISVQAEPESIKTAIGPATGVGLTAIYSMHNGGKYEVYDRLKIDMQILERLLRSYKISINF